MGIKIQWGLLPVPEQAIAVWGARGILGHQRLDLLPDRQDFQGGTLSEEERKRFIDWINQKALPTLRKTIAEKRWRNDSTERYEFSDGGFHLAANCNRSYGYLYIICWQEDGPRSEA